MNSSNTTPGQSESIPASADASGDTFQQLQELARRLERERDRVQASEQHLRAIVDTTPECVKIVARDGTLLDMNPSGLRMMECDCLDLLAGSNIYDVIAPEDRERFRRFNETVCGGEKGVLEFDIVGLHGTRRHMETHAAPLRYPDGRIVQLALTRDITARTRRDAMLRFLVELNNATQSLSDPDELMATAACLLGEHLRADRCAYAHVENEDVFVITGDYSRGVPSIIGRWPVAAFGAECVRQMLANEPYVVTDSGRDERINASDREAYRATRIVAVICVPLHKAGRFTAAMAVHQQQPRQWTSEEIELVQMVTARCWEALERAHVLHDLRASEERLRFMAAAMPQKMFTSAADGGIDYCNPQWPAYSGRAPEDMFGWAWIDMVHPDDRAENLRRWQHSLATGEAFEIEHRFRRHDGSYRWHLTRAHAMRDALGNVSLWIGTSTDIEDQKRAEETLEQKVAERTVRLQETIGELEAFSYSIAHDLRAPLRSLQGYSDVLVSEHSAELQPEAQVYLRRIASAAGRMDRLVQDVLSYSRVVRGDLPLSPVELEPLLREITTVYPTLGPAFLQLEIAAPLPTVRGNEAMLMQIFSNLLGNAVKFIAPDTRPLVRIHTEEAGGRVRLAVADNGIGIPESERERVFEIFHQVDKRHDSTGIGLAIVRKAVERMGGRIEVQSSSPRGTVFVLDLAAA